ncbi:hypothetical protein EZV62_009334 [Acer yangbiense]|uniref:Uncharacterized protein n=1 Tax=Acer yangbiense TaxID=1000413 RepID=A0A5C7IGC2_9ROSI|nr:hypothetical protein EZV62_009334 [Acer yangbiense]
MVYTNGAEYSLSPNSINLSNFSEFGNWFGQAFGKLVEKLKIKFPILGSVPEMPFLSSLRALEITDCCAIKSLQEVMEQSTRLDRLVIEGCDTLMSVAEGQLPSSLKTLEIRSCTNMRHLFVDGEANINGSLLEYLYVSQCPALQFLSLTDQLPEALQHLQIEHCSQLETIGQLPETLKHLVIKRLDRLSSAGHLPASLEHLSICECPITTLSSTGHLPASLQKLKIVNCSELTSLSLTGHLPASLQKLKIVNCSELTSLSSTGHLPASLQRLKIESCSNLTSLSSGQLLPATLKYLNISNCGISSIADGLQNLSNLQQINIFNCPSLKSFPQGGLPRTCLTVFSIRSCKDLVSLPSSMHTLNSLQEMHIEDLPSLSSFPQNGLPINLTSLSIKDLKIQDQVMQLLMQQLHKLTSLRNLSIGGCQNVVCFPQKGKEMRLPTSLTRLTLENFSKLERLSLECFRNLASLECLAISWCPKLTSFLKKDLPSSLLELYISNCSKLTNRCGNGGRYWSNISNIPYVEIDGKYIHEPPPV